MASDATTARLERMWPPQPPEAARVQRIIDGEVPVLHLERSVPTGTWPLVVDGLVERGFELEFDELPRLGERVRYIDLHCVWGWSSPGGRWRGIHIGDMAALARPEDAVTHVLVSARSSPYASCFTLAEAFDGVLAWELDGSPLPPERGGPLRFVPPSSKWAYKAVKWVERITFLDAFRPGSWEERVGDPVGTVPWDVLQRFQIQVERWGSRCSTRT